MAVAFLRALLMIHLRLSLRCQQPGKSDLTLRNFRLYECMLHLYSRIFLISFSPNPNPIQSKSKSNVCYIYIHVFFPLASHQIKLSNIHIYIFIYIYIIIYIIQQLVNKCRFLESTLLNYAYIYIYIYTYIYACTVKILA